MDERRKHPRSPTSVRLQFASAQAFLEHYAANLSLGGLFIATKNPPPMGTELALRFELEDTGRILEVQGKVVHIQTEGPGRAGGVGVSFTNVEPGMQKVLSAYVERLEKEGKLQPPRRQAPRVPAKLVVRFASANAFLQQYAENLSSGGIFIATPNPAPVKSKLELELHLPKTDEILKLQGEVMHVQTGEDGKPRGMGIAFIDLRVEAKNMLKAHVELASMSRSK